MAYWLFKSEPGCFSRNRPHMTEHWDGVRNYLRDAVKPEDQVLFYHSSIPEPLVVGIVEVVRGGYPDFTAFDPGSEHFDPKSSPGAPTWYMVDVRFVAALPRLGHWQLLVVKRYAVRTRSGALILLGDGVKTAKEAEYMPGVKKLHQESENSGKAPWIFGHHFGVVGLLAGGLEKLFCIPLAAELHEGATALRQLQGKEAPKVNGVEKTTVITLMGQLLATVASNITQPCIAVLDAYFAAAPMFAMAKALRRENGERLLHIITRAKGNVVAREQHPGAYGGRGRPPKYGKKIRLKELFSSRAEDFASVVINVYGETKTLSILCLDLVWNDLLRFVLVKDGSETFILIGSDLTMAPEEMVSLYGRRFKIEVTFKMFKHIMGGFCYHFWTKAWQVPQNQTFTLEQLQAMPKKTQRLLADAMNAIEAFVNFAMIAAGVMQMLAIEHAKQIRLRHGWWMRTYSSEVPSEEMVKRVIQHEFYHDFRKFKHTAIYRIIQAKRLQSTAVPLKEAA